MSGLYGLLGLVPDGSNSGTTPGGRMTTITDTRMTERDMLDRLCRRYAKTTRNGAWVGRKFLRAEHVPVGLQFRRHRIADFVAVGMHGEHDYEPGAYGAGRHADAPIYHGHEVKVSRSDWLTELADPSKAATFTPYMHYWWLVVSDKAIVRDDLPDEWGLMVASGDRLRVVKHAPFFWQPDPMPHAMTGALMRAIATTETRLAREEAR